MIARARVSSKPLLRELDLVGRPSSLPRFLVIMVIYNNHDDDDVGDNDNDDDDDGNDS